MHNMMTLGYRHRAIIKEKGVSCILEEVEVIKLIVVLQDSSLQYGGIDPGDEVFHAPENNFNMS